jgi:hypothetical protein
MGLAGSSGIAPRTRDDVVVYSYREEAQLQSVTGFTCHMEFRDRPKLGKTRLPTAR